MFINQKIHIFGEFWRSCQSDLQIGNGLLPLAALVWFMIITRTYYLFPDIISRSFEGPVFAGSVGPDGWPWVRAVTSHAAALPTSTTLSIGWANQLKQPASIRIHRYFLRQCRLSIWCSDSNLTLRKPKCLRTCRQMTKRSSTSPNPLLSRACRPLSVCLKRSQGIRVSQAFRKV